jgi:hypothetical protein
LQKLSTSQAGPPFGRSTGAASTAADDVPAVAEIFGFAPWEYHSPAFEIAQRRLSFIELVSRRMIELSIVDLWTSKILFSDRESMLVVTQMSD